MKEMKSYIKTLAPEMQERMMACESMEEIAKLARTEGLELPDEALYGVYGGCGKSYTYQIDDYMQCKTCSQRVQLRSVGHDGFPDVYACPTCFTTKAPSEVQRYYNKRKVPK